mmetsp:Transcript_9261/g.10559  ORF Transcript_9261/g.10559 Transcript_9261/m.10559 type:complete len:1032 (+) Transcript_9261:154-3249(+)
MVLEVNEIDGAHDEANVKLVEYDEIAHKAAKENRKEEVRFLFCIVFPAVPSGPQLVDKVAQTLSGPCRKATPPKTVEELKQFREETVKHLREAGFVTSMFYSTSKKEIICRVGATDERLLAEADALEYQLELDPYSLQRSLEREHRVTIEDAEGESEKIRRPIYLGFGNYTSSEFKEYGLDTRYKAISSLLHTHMGLSQARSVFQNQTRTLEQIFNPGYSTMTPFEHIHVEYNPDWEDYLCVSDNVQIYRTYNDGTILRTADRIQLLIAALERDRVPVKGYRGGGMDLTKLAFEKDILASFPIQFSKGAQKAGDLTAEALFDKWKQPIFGCFGPRFFIPWVMPLDDIRNYAGEKIAYYFAFLGFYSLWLVPAALVGFAFFCLQLASIAEVDDGYNPITRAADVEELNATLEGDFDTSVGIARSIDGQTFLRRIAPTEINALPYYALFISLWGTFFLEFWKRNQARLALKWGVSDYKRTAQIRPEFEPNYFAPSPVTGLPVPYRSGLVFGLKFTTSIGIVGGAVGITISVFAATYIFKVFMASETSLDPTIAPQIALVVNAMAIIVLGIVFKKMAAILTDWENHRTDVEFENHLIGKTFVFTFFNSYTTLMYFAFVRQHVDLPPNDQTQYCIERLIEFDANGTYADDELIKVDSCYGAVGYSLAIIFASQILVNNGMEIGIPMATQLFKKYQKKAQDQKKKFNDATGINLTKGIDDAMHKAKDAVGTVMPGVGEEKAEEPDDDKIALVSPAEHQLGLSPYETPFDDYLELALQFGYVTLFVSAFPLAPMLALLNNVVETWVDASKVCLLSRRPSLPKAQDIGTWLTIFTILNYLSVVINSAILLFTSRDVIPVDIDDESQRVWLFLAFILLVMFIKLAADFFIPDVPIDVEIQLERQEYYLRKVFYIDGDEEEDEEAAHNTESSTVIVLPEDVYDIEDGDPYLVGLLEDMKSYVKLKYPDVHEAFDALDLNSNAEIDLVELRKALADKEIGIGEYMNEYELKLVMAALDVDGDGGIQRDEFAKFMEADNVEI